MADDISEIWNPYEQAKRRRPFGNPNPNILNDYQILCLKEEALSNQIKNLNYLCTNPEVHAIIRIIFKDILLHQPDDIMRHVALFFEQPRALLRSMIQENLKDIPVRKCFEMPSLTVSVRRSTFLPIVSKTKSFLNIESLVQAMKNSNSGKSPTELLRKSRSLPQTVEDLHNENSVLLKEFKYT